MVRRAAPVAHRGDDGVKDEAADQENTFPARDHAVQRKQDERAASYQQGAAVAQHDLGCARHRLDEGAQAQDEQQVDQRGANDGADGEIGNLRRCALHRDGQRRRGRAERQDEEADDDGRDAERALQHDAAADHALAAQREQHETGRENPPRRLQIHRDLTPVCVPPGSAADRRQECRPRVPEQDETCSALWRVQRGYRCGTGRLR